MSTVRVLCSLSFVWILCAPFQAQTSGATAPEVTQFEPVDINGLVDPATGDLSYSLPAMVIPGAPGGAYPLALSYHAGILYDQESSWVGLGWNLQPGSIARIVRGYPDDWNDARIERFEKYATVYSYSIGLNYGGASVGVQWDNHNGVTGGSIGVGTAGLSLSASVGQSGVGFSLGYSHASSLNVGISYHSGGNWGVEASMGKTNRYGVSYSKETGIGVNFSLAQNSGQVSQTGVSLSSDGVSFSRSFGREGDGAGFSVKGLVSVSTNTAFNGSFKVATSGFKIVIPICAVLLELGFAKTKITKEETASAYGLLHMAKVRAAEDKYMGDIWPNEDELDVLLPGAASGRERGVALDVHVQSYATQTGEHPKPDADYASTLYDVFSVAAQGVHGIAKPLVERKGWIRPADETVSIPVKDHFRLHPYRSFLKTLTHDYSYNPFVWKNLFWKNGVWNYFDEWTNPITQGSPNATTIETNMVFLNDPGLAENQTLANPFFSGTSYDPRHHFEHAQRIRNRSKSIKYFLDTQGEKIERIEVVRPDGLRYIFGHWVSGAVHYGAAPRILYEEHQMQVKTDNSAQNRKATTVKKEPYAYAWYLAAIESPDYLDGDDVPGYSSGDFGSYLALQYAMGNPAYWAITPWSDDAEQPAFAFTGSSVINAEVTEYFERSLIKKELVYPYLAKTATHAALFKLDFGRQDALSMANSIGNASSPYKPSGWMWIEIDPTKFQNGHVQVPAGLGLRVLETYPQANFSLTALVDYGSGYGIQEVLCTSSYKGLSADGQFDLFYLDIPPSSSLKGLLLKGSTLEETHGSAKLDEIRLYDLETLQILEADLPSVTLQSTIWRDFNFLFKPLPGNPAQNAALEQYQSKVVFDYGSGTAAYRLARGTPNSKAWDKGRLTLKGVKFYGKAGVQGNPGYRFGYKDHNLRYTQPECKDPWGFPSRRSTLMERHVEPFLAGEWSLDEIETPTGALIEVTYASDFYTRAQQFSVVEYAELEHPNTTTVKSWTKHDLTSANIYSLLATERFDVDGLETPAYRTAREQFLAELAGLLNLPGTPSSGQVQDRITMKSSLTYQISDHYKNGESIPRQIREHFTPAIGPTGSGCTIIAEPSENPEMVRWLDWLHHHRHLIGVSLAWDFSATFCFIDKREGVEFTPFMPGPEFRAAMLENVNTCTWESENGQHCFLECDVKSLPAFRTVVAGQPIHLPNSHWDEKVLARAWNKHGSKVFQIRLKQQGTQYNLDALDPEFLKMTAWSHQAFKRAGFYRRYCDSGPVGDGALDGIASLELAFFPADANNVPLPIQLGGLIGKYGGGIRVTSLKLKDPANAADSYSLLFSYHERSEGTNQILTDRDSGALFFEPSSMVTSAYGTYGDDRAIRAEEHAYLNFPGGEVVYGCVATETENSAGLIVAKTVQEFYTAADEIVAAPFKNTTSTGGDFVESVFAQERVRDGNGSAEIPSNLLRYKYNGNSNWTSENYPGTVKYFIEAPDQKLILDNTGLIGQPKRTTVWDPSPAKKLSETEYLYHAGFDANTLSSQFLVKNLTWNGSELQDLAPPSDLGVNARLGVDVDQNLAFVLRPEALPNEGDQENPHYNLYGRMLIIDEVRNHFRLAKTVTKGFPASSQEVRTEQEVLAYEFRTGEPLLDKQTLLHGNGSYDHFYSLSVPAHVFYAGMAGRGLIGQAGMNLVGKGATDLIPTMLSSDGAILNAFLAMDRVEAQFQHWRSWPRGAGDSNPSWISDATYSFVHDSAAKDSTAWFDLDDVVQDAMPASGLLNMEIQASQDADQGTWISANQNTVLDRNLQVMEARDFRNGFSAARYIHNGTLVAAVFGNAQTSQVYYQGFEEETTSVVTTAWNDAFTDANAYLANFAQAHSGTKALSEGTPFTVPAEQQPSGNGYIGWGVSDARTQYWVTCFVSTTGATPSMTGDLSGATATKVEAIGGRQWYWVRKKGPLLATVTLSCSNGTVDDLAIYPASSGGSPGEETYKSDAGVSIFGYHPFHRQVTSITDARGFTARFQYDARGQLLRSFDTRGQLKTEHYKSYQGEPLSGPQPQ